MAVDVGTYEAFGFNADPIVIRRYLAGIKGGKVLDTTGFTEEFIRAGHVIVREKASDTYRPLGVSGGAYVTLPDGSEYVGVVVASKSVKEPFVSIMHTGVVNDVACPYPFPEGLKAAVPTLVFEHD